MYRRAHEHQESRSRKRARGVVLAVLLAIATLPAAAEEPTFGGCAAAGADVHCAIRYAGSQPLAKAAFAIGDAAPIPAQVAPYPGAGEVTAVLILIDTSDPAREKVVRANAEMVAKLVGAAPETVHLGVSAFDHEVRVIAPFGGSAADLAASTQKVHATGKLTELYRAVIESVKAVAQIPAARRAVFLISDGLAEDTAYGHADAVKAALAADVAVFGIAYPAPGNQGIGAQTLRRLAEETGGSYWEADGKSMLPASFLSEVFPALNGGGTASAAVAALALPAQPQPVRLLAETADGRQLVLNAGMSPAAESPVAQKAFPWLPMAGAAVVLVAGLVLALRRKKPARAWLIALDGKESRHAIAADVFRIGRKPDNDLALANTSVSGAHAVISRGRDGSFRITDLESMNGTVVNGAPAKDHLLADGDLIELGEVKLRFKLAGSSPAAPQGSEP